MKEETRPRPRPQNKTPFVPAPGATSTSQAGQFPETLKMGKQAACQLTRAPMHSDRLMKNHLAGSAPQWGGLHHSRGSRCPLGQKEKQHVSIHLNLGQRGPQSRHRAQRSPSQHHRPNKGPARSSPYSQQPQQPSFNPALGTLAAHALGPVHDGVLPSLASTLSSVSYFY